jgi:hypothetical protein
MPTIRIDNEVYEALKARAMERGMVFGSPNDVLRHDYLPPEVDQERPSTPTAVITVPLREHSVEYNLIPVRKDQRAFFPGYKVPFILETDIGTITTHVTSALKGTPKGDPKAGGYIRKDMKAWFHHHRQLGPSSTVQIKTIEPGKRYRLSILSY